MNYRDEDLYDNRGNLKPVSTFTEAKRVMQHYSPIREELLQENNLKKSFVLGVCSAGTIVTGMAVLGAANIPLIPIVLGAAGISTIKGICTKLKEKRKNESIMNGSYFEGKSEEEIIKDANMNYVGFNNRKNAVDAYVSGIEKGEDHGRSK